MQIGLVGAGFMGTAVMHAIRSATPEAGLFIAEKDAGKRSRAIDALGAEDMGDRLDETFRSLDLLVLAVKPQDSGALAEQMPFRSLACPLVSVLAGTSITRLQKLLRVDKVVRMMPNLAAEIGAAVVGVSYAANVTEHERAFVRDQLHAMGTLLDIPESLMPAITGVSGSGIAFAWSFIHAMAMGGVKQGLRYDQALRAARDVVASASAVLEKSGTHPLEMVSRVCSPAGTTIDGIAALEEGGMTAAVMQAIAAAAARSRDLES